MRKKQDKKQTTPRQAIKPLDIRWFETLHLDDVRLNDFRHALEASHRRSLFVHCERNYRLMHEIIVDLSEAVGFDDPVLFKQLFVLRPKGGSERMCLWIDEPSFIWTPHAAKRFNQDFCHLIQKLDGIQKPYLHGALHDVMRAFQKAYRCFEDL
jgi:hypothetical protein